jgi:hypothetical protein
MLFCCITRAVGGWGSGVYINAEGPYMAENQMELIISYVVGKLSRNIKMSRNFTFSISNYRRVLIVVFF